MIDSQDFAIRLQKIMDHYDLSAAAFAEKIGVQRSSISHLLSGRNKPSLDFVMKVTDTFSEVTLNWLLYGKDSFPIEKLEVNKNVSPSAEESHPEKVSTSNTFSKKNPSLRKMKNDSSIDRIIIFYKDGRFDEYQN